ncbi:MAG: hypothetical protein MI919_43335 [Holophagales bacterium]|nr:hypothetical protein [Holophagales bacterium]
MSHDSPPEPSRLSTRQPGRHRICLAGLVVLGLVSIAAPASAQLQPPPEPAGNPLTPAKANLGKVLFWEEQISSTRTVSCGTCHIPADGGGDPRSATSPLAIHPGADGVFGGADDVLGSPGVPSNNADGSYHLSAIFGLREQATNRRTSPSVNAGYSPTLFWDGRAPDEFVDPVTQQVVLASGAALESQAVGPIVNEVEMGHIGRLWSEALARLQASEPLALATDVPAALGSWINGRSYPELFEEAFGTNEVTAPRVAMAIASYERTQFTNQAPFDDFLNGNDDALTLQERAGRTVFLASSCDRCHSFAIMSDHDFHYTGVRPPAEDPGRFDVTGVSEDLGRMRTPSLRNVELRPPFMHNGRFATLEDVVDFYDRGGDFDAPNKDELIRELALTPQQKADLLAFLKRPLTDPRLAAEQPPFDRPTLYTETDRVPLVEGTGIPIAGAPFALGGMVPQVVAIEPPILGNPSFTVGIYDAGASTQALLVIDSEDPGLTLPVSGELAFENVALQDPGSGNHYGSFSLGLSADPQYVGREYFGRWYLPGAAAGGGPAVSQVFRFTIFGENPEGVMFRDGFETGNTSRWASAVP